MLKENSLVANKCYGIVVKDLEASNIDNIQDFKILDTNLKDELNLPKQIFF